MSLTCREETKQPRHLIAGLPAPWVLSSAGKLNRYLHGSYFLSYRNTVSTLDASGATKYYRTHYNQWCCLHRMGQDKSCTRSALSSTSWVDTPLTADWLQVCFDTRTDCTYPTFNTAIRHLRLSRCLPVHVCEERVTVDELWEWMNFSWEVCVSSLRRRV